MPIVPNLPPDRAATLAALLDEFSSNSPTGAMNRMRHWPAGRLSLVHVNVLMVLDADGPLPMRSLAEALDVSQASATGIIDRMEQRGLVARTRDAEDRRVIRVAVADPGRQLITGFADDRRSHLVTMFEAMTDEELAAFLIGARAMRRVREQFHAQQAAATATGGDEPAGGRATPTAGDPAPAADSPAPLAHPNPSTPQPGPILEASR